jgi:hypothetical protein
VVAGTQICGRVEGPILERMSVSILVPTRRAPGDSKGPARDLGGGVSARDDAGDRPARHGRNAPAGAMPPMISVPDPRPTHVSARATTRLPKSGETTRSLLEAVKLPQTGVGSSTRREQRSVVFLLEAHGWEEV